MAEQYDLTFVERLVEAIAAVNGHDKPAAYAAAVVKRFENPPKPPAPAPAPAPGAVVKPAPAPAPAPHSGGAHAPA